MFLLKQEVVVGRFSIYSALLCLFLAASSAVAQSPSFTEEIHPNTVTKTIVVGSGATAAGSGVVYYTVKGNISEIGRLVIEGPGGLRARARARQVTGSKTDTLNASTGWQDLEFRLSNGKKSKVLEVPNHNTPPPGGGGGGGGREGSLCDVYSPEELQEIVRMYNELFETNLTPEEFCRQLDSVYDDVPVDTGDSGDTAGGVSGRFVLHKDTCSVSSSGQYLVRVDLSFQKVPANILNQGFSLGVTAERRVHDGSRAAKLKKKSEGKFSPNPILLMNSIGGGAEYINLIKWKGKKPSTIKSQTRIPVADYTFHGGRTLTRSPIGKYLKGGKGVFELTNDFAIYSVCFHLKKIDQLRNGY